MKRFINMLLLLIIITLIISCGKATVEPSNESYEPHIVNEGFLEATQDIDRIYITLNLDIVIASAEDPDMFPAVILFYYLNKITGKQPYHRR